MHPESPGPLAPLAFQDVSVGDRSARMASAARLAEGSAGGDSHLSGASPPAPPKETPTF